MNRETLAIGMTEYAGIASLLLAAIISGAFDLLRSRVIPARHRCPVRRVGRGPSDGKSHPLIMPIVRPPSRSANSSNLYE